jgi:hypothetical protein
VMRSFPKPNCPPPVCRSVQAAEKASLCRCGTVMSTWFRRLLFPALHCARRATLAPYSPSGAWVIVTAAALRAVADVSDRAATGQRTTATAAVREGTRIRRDAARVLVQRIVAAVPGLRRRARGVNFLRSSAGPSRTARGHHHRDSR